MLNVKAPQTWICSTCTNPNPLDKEKCLACEARPLETALGKPVVLGGSVGIDGFKFGSAFVPSGGVNSNLLPTGIGSGGFTFTGGSAKQTDSKE